MSTFDKDFRDATLEASFGNTQQGVNEMCNIVEELRDSMCILCKTACDELGQFALCDSCYYRKEIKNGER